MKNLKSFISMMLSIALISGLLTVPALADAAVTITATGGSTTVRILTTEISGITADSYEYQWYHNVDDQENGTYTPIYLETGSTYTITPDDVATWIRCEVTPITGGVRGAAITSNKYHQDDGYRTWRINNGGPGASKDNPSTYFVNIGGENLLILNEYEDSVYAITAGFKGWHTFGSSSTNLFDPTDSSNIGYWLNNDFLTGNTLPADIQPYLLTHKWWVGPGNDGQRSPYSFNANVSLLAVEEYEKYKARIGWAPYGATANWWLRNTRGWTAGPNINTVSYSNNGQANGADTGEKSLLVRPTFYLDDDIFLEKKANITTMGSGIKEMLVRRYTSEQLSGLYTDQELATIGFDVDCATLTPDTAKALTTLTANYTDEDAESYEYEWYLSNDGSSYYKVLSESSDTYKVSNYDMNKYIKAVITPVYGDGSKGDGKTTNVVNVTELGRVSRTDYGDDREANKSNPTSNYVKVGGEGILILDEYDDASEAFYAMTAHFKGRKAFDSDNTTKFDPTDSTNIGYVINNGLLNGTFSDNGVSYGIASAIQNYISTHTWWTEAGNSGSNSPSDYSVSAKVGLLSRSEYEKYWGKFGWDPSTDGVAGWWLRSGRGTGGSANTVFVSIGSVGSNYPKENQSDWANTWDKAANSTGYYIRPTFYLNENLFKNVKADISTMGSAVKRMFVRRYTPEQLSGLYTDQELKTIGFDVDCAELSPTSPKALTQLTVNYTDENAVDYEYEWYVSESENSGYYRVLSESSDTYLVSNYDMNKYIKAVVTPVYQDGTTGDSKTTNAVNVTELGRLSRTGYSTDREDNRQNPEANYVSIGGEGVLILDEYSDTTESYFVLSAHAKGRTAFDSDNTTKFDPTDSNNIGYTINNSLLNGTFTDSNGTACGIANAVQSYIPTHTWWTEAGNSGSNSSSDYSVNAKIGLLSRSEYEKYWGKFGWDPNSNISGWWLRSGRGSGGSANTVFVSIGTLGSNYPKENQSDWANTWDKAANSTNYYVRPAYYLTEDVFRNVKANVSTMGSDVKEMLVRRYDKSELQGLYTDDELEEIGFTTNISMAAKYLDVYSKSEAVAEISYVAQDMGDIIVSYTNGTVSDSVSEFMYPDDVYEDTLIMSKLPYGENDVTITIKDEMDNTISERNQKMYIIPDQPATVVHDSGIAFHIDEWLANRESLELVRKLGFTKVRADFPWGSIEDENGFNFNKVDAFVAEADRLGISITAILDYNNLCYTDDENKKGAIDTDIETAAFLNYAETVARRYPQITEYEVWNEPNNPNLWSGAANATQYSNLVDATATRLYGIDPDITVIAGAIDVSKDAENFTNSMFTNGVYDYMDSLSIHPYFSSSITNFENRLSTFGGIILSNGGFKRLASTEFGFNVSSGDTQPEITRAQEAVKAIVTADKFDAEDKYYYTLSSDKYGILTEDYEVCDTIYPIAYVNAALGDARFVGKITSGTLSKFVYIKNDGSEVSVCWSTSNKSYTLLSGEKAYDMNGNAISGSTITISSSPVYIYGTSNANGAKTTEINERKAAITSRFPSITSSVLSASNAKAQIMANNSLSAKDKSTALYMLNKVKKIEAVYASRTNTSDLTIPTAKLAAVDDGNNIYSKAALKMASDYIAECQAVQASSMTGKNNVLAGDIMIANDLIESAKLLSPAQSPSIKNVAVNDGTLTFTVKNVDDGDVYVATYSGSIMTSVQKLTMSDLSCQVGNSAGKIFVWSKDGIQPLAPMATFGN